MTRLLPLVIGAIVMATLGSVSAYQSHYGPAGLLHYDKTMTPKGQLADVD